MTKRSFLSCQTVEGLNANEVNIQKPNNQELPGRLEPLQLWYYSNLEGGFHRDTPKAKKLPLLCNKLKEQSSQYSLLDSNLKQILNIKETY